MKTNKIIIYKTLWPKNAKNQAIQITMFVDTGCLSKLHVQTIQFFDDSAMVRVALYSGVDL